MASAKCFRCIPQRELKSLGIYLTLQWFIRTQDSFDPDARAYFAAAGITDPTEKNAINTFVLGLKNNGTPPFWDSEVLLYPLAGSSASSHAVNLKTPGTFNLTYPVPGLTHNALGMKGDGVGAYADTGYKPRTQGLTAGDCRVFTYCYEVDTVGTDQYYWGANDTSPTTRFSIRNNAAVNAFLNTFGIANQVNMPFTADGSVLTQVAGSAFIQYAINGGGISSAVWNVAITPDHEIYLLALDSAGFPFGGTYSTATISGFSVGSRSLTGAEWPVYYGLWQALQTSLSRQKP